MKLLHNRAIVKYNTAHNKVLGRGLDGIEIIRAEQWERKESNTDALIEKAELYKSQYQNAYTADSKYQTHLANRANDAIQRANESILESQDATTQYQDNENYLETNPQIATILHPNATLPYKEGDTVFLHYMAWEWAEITEYGHLIDTDFILFQIVGDEIVMRDGVYLGEAVYSDEEVTPSGIILLEGKKDNLRVKLTHIPKDSILQVGQTVLSIDKNNYEFDYWGKKYIKLSESEIVGVIN